MKRLHSFAFYALIAPAMTLGAGSLLAQQSTGLDTDGDQGARQSTPRTTQDEHDMKRAKDPESQAAEDRKNTLAESHMKYKGYIDSAPVNGIQASKLIGAKVKTTGGDEIGPVSDLVIDKNGKLVAIVVGVGGFLGMGEKDVAIDWDSVTRSGTAGEPELRINASRESLRIAPDFDADGNSNLRSAKNDKDMGRDMQNDPLVAADRRNTDAKYGMQKRGYLGSVPVGGMQADELIGAEVKTAANEEVGPVSDLIIDENGQVVAVVVGVGGFLGMGERDVAIGWDDVTRSGTHDELELRINVTREALRAAPEFESKDY